MPNLPALRQVREELAPMKIEFGNMLPAHITPEKFAEIVMTAVERDPDLLNADRQSLWIACKEAANDGLLPDKKEGAFVIFKTEVMVPTGTGHAKESKKIPMVKWMPMVFGIRKKMFQTGLVKDIQVEPVHKNDFYKRAAGDEAMIVHEPLDFGDRGPIIGCYAIITKIDGGVFREVMSMDQIEAVSKIAKTDKVWNGPFRGEMVRKTVLRRLAKQVPLTAEVDQVMNRDDALYNIDRETAPLLSADGPAPIPSKSLFGNRAVKKLAPAVVEESNTVTAGEAEIVAPTGLPEQLQAMVDKVTAAERISQVARIEADVEAADWFHDLTGDDRGAFFDYTAAMKEGLAEWSKGGEIKDAVVETIVLRAKLKPSNGVQEFDDVVFWRGDIEATARRLSPVGRVEFWKDNADFIQEAQQHYPEEVAKLRDLATKLKEESHGNP